MGEASEQSRLPHVGEVIDGRYRVEKLLGEGGMGAVYAAQDDTLNEKVAIKAMLPALRQHASWARRFIREARAARAIRNEHVAEVLNVGELPGGTPYMVLELLVGRALDAEIRARAPLPVAEAVDKLLQACEAVAHAHALGIVHRDLKPANLFLARRRDGVTVVKVLDFGIAKADVSIDPRTCNASLTESGHTLGTPEYMSPEQLRWPKEVDGRSDIWALGLILHKMLTGRAAFEAEGLLDHVGMIVSDPPTPLRARRPEAPAELEAVVLRCLQRRPEDRFPSVAELASALLPFASAGAEERVTRISNVVDEVEQQASTKPLDSPELQPAAGVGSRGRSSPTAPTAVGIRGNSAPATAVEGGGSANPPRQPADTAPAGQGPSTATPIPTAPAAPFVAKTISQPPPGIVSEPPPGPTMPSASPVVQTISQPPPGIVSEPPPGPTMPSASPVAATISEPPPPFAHSPSAAPLPTTPAAPFVPRTISQQPPPLASAPSASPGRREKTLGAPWLIGGGALLGVAALVACVVVVIWVVQSGDEESPGRAQPTKSTRKSPAKRAPSSAATAKPGIGTLAKPSKPTVTGPPKGMITVPAGPFLMGTDHRQGGHEDGPQRTVTLDGFYIDRTEVTVAAYRACVDAGKCSSHRLDGKLCNWGKSSRDNHPINCLGWSKAQAYCQWVGKRLPTEAQWEKAARGKDGRRYPWGNTKPSCSSMGSKADYGCGDYDLTTHPVGVKPEHASPYGVLDMGGNVREWVADWYDIYALSSGHSNNPTGPSRGTKRSVRGGDRHEGKQGVWDRSNLPPDIHDWRTGFRCAKPLS